MARDNDVKKFLTELLGSAGMVGVVLDEADLTSKVRHLKTGDTTPQSEAEALAIKTCGCGTIKDALDYATKMVTDANDQCGVTLMYRIYLASQIAINLVGSRFMARMLEEHNGDGQKAREETYRFIEGLTNQIDKESLAIKSAIKNAAMLALSAKEQEGKPN